MAADLHIHVKTPEITDDVLACFFSSTIGSKYFSIGNYHPYRLTWEQTYDIVKDSPSAWIGEVSWLKAALFKDLFKDEESFVPNTVLRISELIGEDLPVLDEELTKKILGAFKLENTTGYSIELPERIEEFLKKHQGERLFTVSW